MLSLTFVNISEIYAKQLFPPDESSASVVGLIGVTSLSPLPLKVPLLASDFALISKKSCLL